MESTKNHLTKFDEKLKEIECFKKFGILLPFIGTEYEKYKILQIAESRHLDGYNFTKEETYQIIKDYTEGKAESFVFKIC